MTFLAFLRRELAPTPGRWLAALRIVAGALAAVIVTVLLGEGAFPHGHWAITTIFTVSQADAGASLRKAIRRVIGTLVGGLAGILVVCTFADLPALYVPVLAAVVGLGIFASLTTTESYVMILGSLTFVLVTFYPPGADASAAVETGLWRIVAIVIGVICGTGAQLVLWPDDPEVKLREALAARLESVARVLAALAAREDRGDDAPPVPALASEDLTTELDLLANTEARHPSLRQRHTEHLALIVEADRLVTTGVWLVDAAREWSSTPEARLRRRFRILGEECTRLAEALTTGRPPAASTAPVLDPLEPDGGVAGLRPTLEDMRLALGRMRNALGFLDPTRPIVAAALDTPARTPLLTPAFSLKNTEAIALALKAALAILFTYVVMHALTWSALVTAGVTAVIVSQTSFGATIQKSLLRIGGAAFGGALGIVTIMVAMPNITALGGLLIVAGLGFWVSAWIAAGSARISYMGMQAGMAFAMCVTDPSGPTTDLTPAKDRVLGILVGIVAMLFVDALWPVRARLAMWKPLARALRALADLARFAPDTRGYGAQLRQAVQRRSAVYSQLSATVRLSAESALEPDAGEAKAERNCVGQLTAHAQTVFLALLALIRHRVSPGFPGLPAPTQDAMRALDYGVGEVVDALADRLAGKPRQALPDLAQRLASLEALYPADEAGAPIPDGAAMARRAARDHVAIARGLVREVLLLATEVDAALSLRRMEGKPRALSARGGP